MIDSTETLPIQRVTREGKKDTEDIGRQRYLNNLVAITISLSIY